jgi:hypothetical protein
MNKKRVGNNRLTSSLQEEILKHVATTPNAGYDTLTNQIKKARTTIIQSLETLIKGNYVNKQKIDVDTARNINTIFKPTKKGMFYSVAYLKVSLDSILRTNGEQNDLAQYNALMKVIVDKRERNEFTKYTALALINSDIFDDSGEMKLNKAEDFFNIGFVSGLTGFARQDPEVQVYFNKLNIDSLRKIMSPEELKQVHNYYSKVQSYLGNVLDAVGKGLSTEK